MEPLPSNRLKAHELLNHKFINKNGGVLTNYSSNKKEKLRKNSGAKSRISSNDILANVALDNRRT